MGRVILVLALVLASRAEAAEVTAKEAFEKGTAYFEAEEFEAALPWFEKAYELSGKKAASVLALAQCERALKRYDAALVHFREYLAIQPRPKSAAEVESTIPLVEELAAKERAVREAAAAPPPPPVEAPTPSLAPPPEAPPPEARSIWSGPLPWIIAGAVAVGGGVSLAFALSSSAPELSGGNTGVVFRP